MHPYQDNSVSLKILFEKEKKQVICAEAGSDFVDILFSFLTLPMGTIVRLLQKKKSSDSAQIGCISNLYQSVKDLRLDIFSTFPCKDMLTYPRNSLETVYKDLKVNVDDTPIRYFLCANIACLKTVSYYQNAKCSCGKLFSREAFEFNANGQGKVVEKQNPKKDMVEVFVKRSATFVVTDEMKVMSGTPGSLVEVFRDYGIKNVNLVEEKVVKVGPDEILNLLLYILVSKTPLTDLIFPNQKLNSMNMPGKEGDHYVASNVTRVNASEAMKIKIFVSKSDKKLLYAEAMDDFVELLLNFLTFPLSNVVRLFTAGGGSSLRCADNLYKSIQALDDKWFVKKGSYFFSKYLILHPGITPTFDCSMKNHVLREMNSRIVDTMVISKIGEIRRVKINSDDYFLKQGEATLSIANPLALKWGNSSSCFLKEPATFTVSDSLMIKPCGNTAINISFLKSLDVSIDDIEEHTIKIGKQQVLSILKSSLTSNSVFSPFMDLLSKKPKLERS